MSAGAKKKPKKRDAVQLEESAKSFRRILKLYDQHSREQNSVPCPDITRGIRLLMEEGELYTQAFLRPIPSMPESIAEPGRTASTNYANQQVAVRPFVRTLIAAAVNTLKVLRIWNICMDLLDCIELAAYLKLPVSVIQTLVLNDCAIQPDPLSRLSLSFNLCGTLRILNLDYNEFGDEGCLLLCKNLTGSRNITQLSLTYCDLGTVCGGPLGQLLIETAIAEIYLDGNQLGCQGAYDLIKLLLLNCERAYIEKQDKIRAENDLKAQEALLRVQQGLPAELTDEEKKAKKKKTKKKKKKTKKSLDDTPPFGPLVTKIHLFDNEIDALQPNGLSIVQQTIQAYARLIEISEDLEELDLDENVIGHVCASLILHALKARKESKLKKIKINVSEKIDPFVFADILKLSAKMKKKRKRVKKKKA